MIESALALYESTQHKNAKAVLERCIFLHAVLLIKQSIDWYIVNDVVSVEAAAKLDSVFQKAVKELLPHMNTVVESLGLPRIPHLYGPIARDYVAFNA